MQLTGNNRLYRFLLNICELVHGAWLVTEEKGSYRFRSFVRDEKRMALVFQYFVYNSLRVERRDLTIFRENINWNARSEGATNSFPSCPKCEQTFQSSMQIED